MQIDPNHKTPIKSNSLSSESPIGKVAANRKKNRKYLYRFPLNLFAELIDPNKHLPVLMDIEIKCFPELMQDQRHDFEEFLQDEFSSGLVLYKDALPIGYIMGSHIDDENSHLALQTSEFIKTNQDRIFYISGLAILEEHRSVITMEFLYHEMVALLKSIDYEYFTAYVRKRHGLSRLLRRRLSAQILHTVENWEETGEPFDYCLVDLASFPTLPVYGDYFISWLRITRQRLKGIRRQPY